MGLRHDHQRTDPHVGGGQAGAGGVILKPYYDHNGITIWHGDCREILPTLPKVDLVLTDPPYNVGVDYGSHVDDLKLDFVAWVKTWFFVCREMSASMLIVGQARLPDYALVEKWKWLLCWYKPAAMGRSPVGFCAWEPIALWGKGSSAGLPDLFTVPIIPCKDTGVHPCPKPLGFFRELLRRFPNATAVLDPFVGSGTMLIEAKRNGQKAIGIEIEERYCEIAAKRLSQEVFDFEPAKGELFPSPTQEERRDE